jgi:hypothetical protein
MPTGIDLLYLPSAMQSIRGETRDKKNGHNGGKIVLTVVTPGLIQNRAYIELWIYCFCIQLSN